MLKYIMIGVLLMGCVSQNKESKIIVPTWWKKDGSFDPHYISYAYEATIAKALFSPLITIDDHGEYVGVLADRFFWDGNTLVFEFFEPKYKSNLEVLGVDEIYSSLVQQSKRNKNLHGGLRFMLESESEQSIRVKENKIHLVFKEKYKQFGLPFFITTEALILPKEIQEKIPNQRYTDFKVSTGPYFVEGFSEEEIILKANKKHINYHPKMPKKVLLKTNIFRDDLYREIKANEDFVIPSDRSIENMEYYGELFEKFSVHKSHPIKLHLLAITDTGEQSIPQKRRFALANRFLSLFNKESINPLKKYFYLFPKNSVLDLSKDQENTIISRRNKHLGKDETGKGLKLSYSDIETIKFLEKQYLRPEVLPDLELELVKGRVENPFYLTSIDTGFTEDFGMLNYFFRVICQMKENEIREFFDDYTNSTNEAKRQKILGDIHYDCLNKAKFLPIGLSSYVIVMNNKWEINKNIYFGDTPFWKFREK